MYYLTVVFVCLSCWATAQQWNLPPDLKWYHESTTDGLVLQNSFPKGGPYPGGETEGHYNPSYLVFFTRIVNTTSDSLSLDLRLSADPIPIPGSPDTYVKLFLPTTTMTPELVGAFSYGITELDCLTDPTFLRAKIAPGETLLFHTVAFFYQTDPAAWRQERGGNRAKYTLEDGELVLWMGPQVERLTVGSVRTQ